MPLDYDLGLLLVSAGSSNPMRLVVDVRPTVSHQVYGLNSAGATASWTSESSEAPDEALLVAQPTWTTQKWTTWFAGSVQLLGDSDLGSEVTMLIADAEQS